MPRARSRPMSLAVVQAQISHMQAALAKLQVEIARMRRAEIADIPRSARPRMTTLRDARQAAEREFIIRIGEDCGWNRSRMARELSVDRKSIYRKMSKYGLVSAHPAPTSPTPHPATKPARRAKGGRRR